MQIQSQVNTRAQQTRAPKPPNAVIGVQNSISMQNIKRKESTMSIKSIMPASTPISQSNTRKESIMTTQSITRRRTSPSKRRPVTDISLKPLLTQGLFT